jgi:Gas vesicle synthesis protein GvpO
MIMSGNPAAGRGSVPPEAAAVSAVDRVRRARAQFQEITGYRPASVSGLARVDGGWEVDIDVVELARIPDTASLLATYRVTTNDDGDVVGYERVRRYRRGQAD